MPLKGSEQMGDAPRPAAPPDSLPPQRTVVYCVVPPVSTAVCFVRPAFIGEEGGGDGGGWGLHCCGCPRLRPAALHGVPPPRVVVSVWPMGRGGGWVGYEGNKKFVYLKWASHFLVLYSKFIFFPRGNFVRFLVVGGLAGGFGWVGGWFGLGGWVRRIPPPPPAYPRPCPTNAASNEHFRSDRIF